MFQLYGFYLTLSGLRWDLVPQGTVWQSELMKGRDQDGGS